MKLKQIRLLPVVILAGIALLVLKGVGIMSGGGYILTGANSALAAGDEANEPAAGMTDTTMAMPVEPTMTDMAPMLDDGAPTLPLKAETASAGHDEVVETAEGGRGDEAGGDETHSTDVAAAGQGQGGESGETTACPTASTEGFDFTRAPVDCLEDAGASAVDPGVNEAGDALPLVSDGAGSVVPLATVTGPATSESAILERLSERRDELDAREAELSMRVALVEAAEKRIEERTAVLEALEARINAMVDEKRTLEESQFVAVVAMYETMKAKDAATIFDQLDMSVLLRVARAMSPRKMAPILAGMDPLKARDLTTGLAVDRVEPTIELTGDDLGALPQIVGQ